MSGVCANRGEGFFATIKVTQIANLVVWKPNNKPNRCSHHVNKKD